MHRRLLSEPCWDGIPQKIEKTTLRHSHRKWKSPIEREREREKEREREREREREV
jgi:hypothetical protein